MEDLRRQRARRPRVRVAAQDRSLMPWLLAFTFLTLAAWTSTAHANDETVDLDRLEVRIWTADEYDLYQLERQTVRAMQLDPRSARAHQLLSHVMIRLFSRTPGDLHLLRQASELAQQAIDLEPQNDAGYVALADILDMTGNPDRALALLNEAEAAGLEPSWRFYFTRARLISDESNTGRVLGLLENALAFSDAKRRIIIPYVVAVLQSEASGEELIVKLQDWNRKFPTELFDLTVAITKADLGRFTEAHQIYVTILQQNPRNKEAKVNDAILLYRNLKDGVRAAALLEDVLKEHKSDLTRETRAMIKAHLAAAYIQQKRYDLAKSTFVTAIELDQGNLSLVDFVTKTYREQNAFAQLAELIKELNVEVPGTGVLYALLGETLSDKLKDFDGALKAFANAITLEPGRSDYYTGMGLTYYRMKNLTDALRLFSTATQVDPNDAAARYNEACVLSLLDRRDEAIGSLTEALALDPRLARNAEADSDFASIKSNRRFKQLISQPPDDNNEVVGH